MSDIGRLTDSWRGINQIIIYGAGNISRGICENIFNNNKVGVEVKCVIDQDPLKQSTRWNGVEIVSYKVAREKYPDLKIVVATGHTAYNNISAFLRTEGLAEFDDFCRIGSFFSEWFWNEKRMNCIMHVDMTITSFCTLNCEGCNMFIPHYEKRMHYPLEELKHNIDLLFQRIDFAAEFGMVGGETGIYPGLADICQYLYDNYRDKYGVVTFHSNGTVLFSDELIEVMKKCNIHCRLSDYTENVDYKGKLDKVVEKLQANDIDYNVNSWLEWCDFGFPERPFERSEEELTVHLNACRPDWNGLNDGRFYYCNVSWSAEKCGKFELKESDYIELKDIDKNNKEECRKIVELSRGTSSFCRVCGGCGSDNTDYIPVGKQR